MKTATWNNNKLYTEAQDALTGSDWGKCAKYFEALEGRDPFGHYAQQAQITRRVLQLEDQRNRRGRPGDRPVSSSCTRITPISRMRII